MIRAAVQRNPAAAWSRPVLLGSGGLAQLASGPRGQAIVVWQQPVRRPAGTVVQAARFSPARAGRAKWPGPPPARVPARSRQRCDVQQLAGRGNQLPGPVQER